MVRRGRLCRVTTVLPAVSFVALSLSDRGRPAFLALFGLLGLLLLHAHAAHTVETFGGGDSTARSKTNCPACGARVPVDADHCDYCERSLTDDEAAPDYGWVET